MKTLIVPAVMAASKKNLASKLKRVKGIKDVQIDIMDGKFVSHRTVSFDSFSKLKGNYEVHLMVKEPLDFIEGFAAKGAKTITFHVDEMPKKRIIEAIKAIKRKKIDVGVALNPETPVSVIRDLLWRIDVVLIMTVHPGKQGQKLMPLTLAKVKAVRKMSRRVDIEVDGGVNSSNAIACVLAGANRLVVGSALFRKRNIKKAIEEMYGSI